MNTKELLFKLAGNDPAKQYRADLWPILIPGPITEAQGKLLLSYDVPDHYTDSGIKRILNMAVSLVEPVYLRTVLVEYAGEGEGNDFPNKSIATALSLITVEGRRTVLKSTENLHSFVIAIEEAIWDRNTVPPYALMPTETVTMPYVVDNIYKAAWCIVEAIDLEDRAIDYHIDGYGYTCNEQYSLKKIKAILKAPERIDRYAQIEHVEYDYSTGYLSLIRARIEAANIAEFEPIWFKTSEDIAAEGAIMNNCIAGYWNHHGDNCCIFACIYKGTRIDVEVSGDMLDIRQCYEQGNKSSALTDELTWILNAAVYTSTEGEFIYANAGTTVYLYDPFGFGELKHKCVRFSAMQVENYTHGRYLVDTDTLEVFRISTVGRSTLKTVDISHTEEGLAVRGWFCDVNNITDDDCFDDEGFDRTFIDFVDDFD